MADPVLWASNIQVNRSTANDQDNVRVAALHNGGFVMVWQDASGQLDGDSLSIKAQIFDTAGVMLGDEIAVNTHTAGPQSIPDVAVLSDGSFVVAWQGGAHPGDISGEAISAQIFSAAGVKFGDEMLATPTSDSLSRSDARVAALDGGGFVIAYEIWNAGGTDIVFRRFADDGSLIGDETPANTTTTGNQLRISVTALGTGTFALAWQDASQSPDDPNGAAIRMRTFNDDGTPNGDEILVNEFTDDDQQFPTLASAGDGTVMVAFRDSSAGHDDSLYLAGGIFDDEGNVVDPEGLLTPLDTGTPYVPHLTALKGGGYLLVWSEFRTGGYHIFGRMLDADGAPIGDRFLVDKGDVNTEELDRVKASELADGRLVVTWQEKSAVDDDPSGFGIRAQIVDPREGVITGTERGETIYGSFTGSPIVDDTIDAGAGADTIFGLDGNDTIDGGAGADTMRGGLGDDVFIFNTSSDKAIEAAGQGKDTVKSTASLVLSANVEDAVLLGTGKNATGNALVNMLTGNGQANTLSGLAGNDRLLGGGGADTLIGGAGRDTQEGGLGNDIFRFLNVSDSKVGSLRDLILDFDKNGNDRIDLSPISPVKLTFIGTAAFTDINQVRVIDIAGPDVLVAVNRSGSLAPDLHIRLANTTAASVTAADFIL
jgi:Ca2+-binding RTX toxin-like protein